MLEMFLAMHNTRVARVQDGVEIINRIDTNLALVKSI